MTFEELEQKILSMSFKEIVLTMVESLEKPVTEICMGSYGHVNEEGICFGCAATNTILRIGRLDPKNVITEDGRLYSEEFLIDRFESAINDLRCGDIEGYNNRARWYGFDQCPVNFELYNLPRLTDEYTQDELNEYRKFAELLP